MRDLWPESAVALGELTNPRAVALATRLEEACYRKARRVVVVSEGIYTRLLERGLPPEKVEIISNGANVELFRFLPERRLKLRQQLGLGDKFVAIYAGIHGIAQGLESLVETARLLHTDERLRNDDVHILLIGDGPRKAEVTALAANYQLPNLTFLSEKPRPEIPGFLSAADVAIIPLRNLAIFNGALPSKMFDAWACQLPVLLSVDGEARAILEEARGGWFVPPEDPWKMAEGILRMKNLPSQERQNMGLNGRSYTSRHYSRQALAEKLLGLLKGIV